MRPAVFSANRLRQFLRRYHIATLPQLKELLGTEADITIFRKLKELSYRTSYSHRGAFYTLDEIAASMSAACGRSTRFGFLVTVPWWPPPKSALHRPRLAILLQSWRTSSTCQPKNPCCGWSSKVGSPVRLSPACVCTAPAILERGSGSCRRGKCCWSQPPRRPLALRPMNCGRRLSRLPA